MDFGLARTAGDPELTHVGDVLGTPRYMSPEQLAGERVDHRADTFAFGCIVHEMLAGKPLFRGRDVVGIITSQLQWTLPQPDAIQPGLADDLYQVLRESLAKEPDARVLDLGRLVSWSGPVDRGLLE
jgi:serine/threonine-protein kinase